ncbi:citrate (Si)-synthase [Candidatus Sumerlaeota bacterium]|nr:citrate (Si)-synthase [Candidatus Sumerlaeota bacterium]
MSETAELKLNGKSIALPVVVGTENERAIDITRLRGQSGYITLDDGYMNTGACTSAITFIDGDKGILRYRGIPIEQIAENSTFVETAYLLIYGDLPTPKQLEAFSERLTRGSMLHEDMKQFFSGYPSTAHPMAILSAMICSLTAYYEQGEDHYGPAHMDTAIARLLAKVRTIAAFSYKKSRGEPFIYPEASLPYCANFLNMLFQHPSKPYTIDPEAVRMLNLLLILHADHEQNCSTSTVRLVGSSQASIYTAIASGICALWGPRHGGANQAVIEMLEHIHKDGGGVDKFIKLAKDKDSKFRLMGFGHRVYKTGDVRARILKEYAKQAAQRAGTTQWETAAEIIEKVLETEKNLFPNLDWPAGRLYHAMGLEVPLYTPFFVASRVTGWSRAGPCVIMCRSRKGSYVRRS